MKQLLCAVLTLLAVNFLHGQALNRYGQMTVTGSQYINSNGATGISGLNQYGGSVALLSSNNTNALDFDGGNDYVAAPSGVYFTGNFTIECWVYPKSFPNWARIIDFGNGAGSDNV